MTDYCSCGAPFDKVTLTFEAESGLLYEEETRVCPTCDLIDVQEIYERKCHFA